MKTACGPDVRSHRNAVRPLTHAPRNGRMPAMRILLVEDEPKMAELIRRVLVAERHVVDRAGAAVGALGLATAAEAVPYDVLVVDRMLPDLDGLDLLRLMRTRGIRTPAL